MSMKASVEYQSRKLTRAFVSPAGTKSRKRLACRNGLLVAGVIILAGTGELPSALAPGAAVGRTERNRR